MKKHIKNLIYLLTLPAFVVAGCVDDDLINGGVPTDPNAIKFSASTLAAADGRTRAGQQPEYNPLVLTTTGDFGPLYLHTYEVPQIGYVPGTPLAGSLTRGNQIASAADLVEFHKNFKVVAKRENGSEFFSWTDTRYADIDNQNIWYTNRTEYWPAKEDLNFFAVSPAAAFDKGTLKSIDMSKGSFSFDYTAQKGETDADAVAQPDLLIATSTCNKKGSQNGLAPLKFHHALSAVKFAVRDVMGGEVVNIKIAGVSDRGRCNFTFDQPNNEGSFSWSVTPGSSATFSQDFNYAVEDRVVDPSDDTKDILLNQTMPSKTFMMIPQQIPADAEIIVTLKRTGLDPETVTLRGKILDNAVTEWKPGHEYVYTISTSKSNWVYELQAWGNHKIQSGDHGSVTGTGNAATASLKGDEIYVYSPSNELFKTYGTNAYMSVRSYRYRANNPTVTDNLKWTASHGEEGEASVQQYRVRTPQDELFTGRNGLTPEEWITTRAALSGNGSTDANGELKLLEFAPSHQVTDWEGDTWMQNQSFYASASDNSETTPWDLSTCGGKINQTTANTYIIDRAGWYSFPLIYGNAKKDGNTNYDAYKYTGTADSDNLEYLVDYNNNAITSPEITGNFSKADIVWTDVYNAISDVKLVGNNIVFKANKYNMQQGNCVIALYDNAGEIVWSWQIWITEHWLDPTTGQSEAQSGKTMAFETSVGSGWRKRGDLTIQSNYYTNNRSYTISPYNVGWCDPKNVDYLRRKGDMVFVQYDADGTTKTGKTVTIPILQDGELVSYKYGNNTYYQWGRKDPFIGFVDHYNHVKVNFGPIKCEPVVFPDNVTNDIGEAIKRPNEFFATQGLVNDHSWSKAYANLWNNASGSVSCDGLTLPSKFEETIKTIYDPCPPGYMVPSSYLYRFLGTDNYGQFFNNNGNNFSSTPNTEKLDRFNGLYYPEIDDEYLFIASVKNAPLVDGKRTVAAEDRVYLTSTGQKWYSQNHAAAFGPGGNFNSQMVYLWSSTRCIGAPDFSGYTYAKQGAYSLALGMDNYNDQTGQYGARVLCVYFTGRTSLGRPVRAIREN